MAEGRGGAVVAMAVLCLLAVALQCDAAATIVVGDTSGWSMNIAGWEKGKKFAVGESLEFNYPKGKHNVVVVNKAGYDACKPSPSDKVYTSGKDVIKLVKGSNYFICSLPGHCAKMKMEITAS